MSRIALVSTLFAVGYLLITVVLGVVGYRRLRVSVEDFFVVSRQLGIVIVFLSISATYHSAFAVLTSTAVAAEQGVAWFVGAASWTIAAGLCAWLFGTRFWRLGRRFGYVTLADLLADFFQSRRLRAVVAVVMAVFTVPYLTVQAIGFGLIITVATDGLVSYELGALVLTVVALFYCVAAGQRAVAWTDVIQGVWMFLAIWIVGLVVAVNAVGGVGALFDEIARLEPELLRVAGTGWSHPLALFSNVFLFGVALVVTMQHMQMKFYAARDPFTIRWSSVLTAAYLSAIYIPAVLTGLTAFVLMRRGALPPLADVVERFGTADALLPLMAMEYAPAVLTGLLFAGALAAATSTKDNFLMATAAVLTRDLYQQLLRPDADDRLMILLSRAAIVVFGLLGWYFATLRPGLIFDIVALALAGTLQFLPAIAAVVFPIRRAWLTAAGAGAGILAGVAVTVALAFPDRLGLGAVVDAHPLELHAGMWGLLANLAVGLAVSRFTAPPPADAVRRIRACLEGTDGFARAHGRQIGIR